MINGQGYPKVHFPRDCHKTSKLIHVCDVYDALRTRRPYRDAWESPRILTYIEERAGTEFEPEAAAAFVMMMKRLEPGIQISPIPVADAPADASPPAPTTATEPKPPGT